MSKKPDFVTELSDTLTLCEFKTSGSKGFWLYDETRGMNLAMRASSEREAFVEALTYYQERLQEVERSYKTLYEKVESFVCQFSED